MCAAGRDVRVATGSEDEEMSSMSLLVGAACSLALLFSRMIFSSSSGELEGVNRGVERWCLTRDSSGAESNRARISCSGDAKS